MKFMLGEVVATRGALDLLKEHNADPMTYISRHLSGVWGDLDDEDKRANEQALKHGGRILSAYNVGKGRLYVITEAVDDRGIRASTCLLLPEEY